MPGLERNSIGLPAELVGGTLMESGQELTHPKLGVPNGWILHVTCVGTLAQPKLWLVAPGSAHTPFLVLGKVGVILYGLEPNLAPPCPRCGSHFAETSRHSQGSDRLVILQDLKNHPTWLDPMELGLAIILDGIHDIGLGVSLKTPLTRAKG